MKTLFTTLLALLLATATFGQASVAYYPFNSVLSVSSNPNRTVWLDGRLQTNTLFGSLGTTLIPMVNLVKKPQATYYVGVGARANFLNDLREASVLEGYSLHVGVRAGLPILPNVKVAFELSPFARYNFKSGIFYSYLGLIYEFRKKPDVVR